MQYFRLQDDEEELFNPNCVTRNLMDNIQRRCRCQKGVTLDLSDEEGELKNLPEYANQYAHKILKGRQKFVLIKIEKGLGDTPTTYTSMLNDLETINPKLLTRLELLSKTNCDGKQKSDGRKESMWTVANRSRKSRGQGGSAGRSRSESTPSNKTDSKGSGSSNSPQSKTKSRKANK
ncbi:hypothetical protein QZH41_009950 [Actinostola sp. cb2023]|nr:hypothetical protein QZH41_009950 [Actinostola sp. cb2023]